LFFSNIFFLLQTDGYKIVCAHYLKNLKQLNGVLLTNTDFENATRTITYEAILKRGLHLLTRPRSLKYSFVTDYCKEVASKRNLYSELDDKLIQSAINAPIADSNWTMKVIKV
jgi:hypothetical protein